MEPLEGFPIVVEFPIQWGDQDAIGHVNNVIYFRWFETSRVTYAKKIGLFGADSVDGPRTGSILAGVECSFRQQLLWPDCIQVGSRVKRVGNSSLQLEHQLFSENVDGLVADAVSTMVSFDFEKQTSIRVSDQIRARIRELEGEREIEGC